MNKNHNHSNMATNGSHRNRSNINSSGKIIRSSGIRPLNSNSGCCGNGKCSYCNGNNSDVMSVAIIVKAVLIVVVQQ